VLRQQVAGYIQADAEAERDGDVVRESGWFRHLRPGEDYYLHPSGLWVALRAPLRPDEALAVTYVTVAGDTIGQYNPERVHNVGEIPSLRLIRSSDPQHQPGRPTWDMEMKQVYRISGADEVESESLELDISLGELSAGRTSKRTPEGRRISLLRLFGLDEDSPFERVDRASLFQPAVESLDRAGVQGTFLFFPTLRPFLEPPPVPSERLSAAKA
jgi:cell surface protein SprA